jgi:hypothetical protein
VIHLKYHDDIYADKDKKYYKRFKAIKKGKRQPAVRDIIYIANILGITEKEARIKKTHIYYKYDIDELLRSK